MYVDIDKLTKAIQKVTDLIAGDKLVPGVLFRLEKLPESETGGTLSVGYSDASSKASVDVIPVKIEETDFIGDVVTPYETLVAALQNLQPHGKIEVDEVRIEYFPESLKLSVVQMISYKVGDEVVREEMGKKHLDVLRQDPKSSKKTEVLTRAHYEEFFDADPYDEYNRLELLEILNRTSVEKGKQIYLSTKTQRFMVANNAYAIVCDVSKHEISAEDIDTIREELRERGITDEASVQEICAQRTNRINIGTIISHQLAKSLIGILSKLKSDTVCISRVDGFSYIFVDNEDEKFSIWYKIPKGLTVHTDAIELYTSTNYNTYQMTMLKDFFVDAVTQALQSTKSEKNDIEIKAEETEDGISYKLSIECNGSNVSMSQFKIDDVIDTIGDLNGKKFNISLKVLDDMLKQLKTDTIGFDIMQDTTKGVTYVRLAEIDMDKRIQSYAKIREGLDDNVPTPVESKLAIRDEALLVKEYTLLK